MKKKLFLHIGAHKSASTTLQGSFFKNSSLLSGTHEIDYLGPERISKSPLGDYFRLLSQGRLTDDTKRRNSLDEATDFARALISESTANQTLISWEGFLGHSALDHYQGLYTHYREVIDSIKSVFSEYDVNILLVLRRQDQFIESCYLQQIKERRLVDFDAFFNSIDQRRLSWLPIVEGLASAFGRDRVVAMPFEMILAVGARQFVGLCLAELTKQPFDGYLFDEVDAHANPSISGVGLELLKRMFELIEDLDRRRRCVRFVFSEFSSAEFGKPLLLREEERAEILRLCLAENRLIFERYISDFVRTEDSASFNVYRYWLGDAVPP